MARRSGGLRGRCKIEESMRKAFYLFQTVLILLGWSGASSLLAQDETVDWLDNYKQAIEEAKRTQKPIFLEFRCEA